MKDKQNNDSESLSIYRYLMTIARRGGVDNIMIRLVVSDGSGVAVIKCGENKHFLPHKSVDADADGDELRDAVRYAVESLGLDAPDTVKYLGSRENNNGTSHLKCFDFEVLVKKKRLEGLKWLRKSDVDILNIPVDEKRILRGYFRREK